MSPTAGWLDLAHHGHSKTVHSIVNGHALCQELEISHRSSLRFQKSITFGPSYGEPPPSASTWIWRQIKLKCQV